MGVEWCQLGGTSLLKLIILRSLMELILTKGIPNSKGREKITKMIRVNISSNLESRILVVAAEARIASQVATEIGKRMLPNVTLLVIMARKI